MPICHHYYIVFGSGAVKYLGYMPWDIAVEFNQLKGLVLQSESSAVLSTMAEPLPKN